MTINNGGPAFPIVTVTEFGQPDIWHGLTKREWFAGMALQGLLASEEGMMKIIGKMPESDLTLSEELAARSYRYANAMISESEKP